MVTAATTASRVSPPFLRMSMPRPRALTPLALEIIRGRLPCPAATAGLGLANRLVTVAAALPASEVRKNLRRDHWLMGPPGLCGGQYTTSGHVNFGSLAICLLVGAAYYLKAAASPPHSQTRRR